jgi:HNH endonuclease
MARVKINNRIADKLMWSSDRTCNLCQKEGYHLEIHHINGNPGDNRYENLILLCRNCHSEATASGLGRKLSPTLLLQYKSFWEGVIQKRRVAFGSGDAKLEEAALRIGTERVARAFENYMVKRDARGVLSMFTPPRTKPERDWLENYILGGNLGRPGRFIRLFATRGFGYKVLKYDLKKLRVVNPKKAEATVEEWRTWWGDGAWDPVPRICNTRLTLVKIGNEWFVDKYREPSASHYRHKYGGLGG